MTLGREARLVNPPDCCLSAGAMDCEEHEKFVECFVRNISDVRCGERLAFVNSISNNGFGLYRLMIFF